MVDCGSPRCAQERRSFRRDLQGWSKKLSVVLGLERIAADYVDKDTASQLLNPYPDWEHEMSHDFEPSKRCFHCEKKLPNVYKRIQRIIDDAKKGKENSGKICLRSLQDLMPFCLDFYTRGFGRELFSDVVKTYFLTVVQQPEIKEEPENQIPSSNSIDILARLRVPNLTIGRSVLYNLVSEGTQQIFMAENTSPAGMATFASPQAISIENKSQLSTVFDVLRTEQSNRKPDSGKQGYTEEDLDSVVSDIRSGKLGTRRAAMIYGIPRSTLRNKIVKPEPEEIIIPDDDEDERLHMMDVSLHEALHAHHMPTFKMTDASIFGMGDPLIPRGSLTFLPAIPYHISRKLEQDDHDHLLELRINQIRRKHNLNGLSEARPRPAHANHLKLPLLVDVVRKLVHQKFMEIKQDYGKMRNVSDMKSKQEAELFSPFGPYFPAFSPYFSGGHNDENLTAPMYKHIMESIYTNMMKEDNPIPKPFGKVNESSRIGDTLKDIIAKTISEKMRFKEGSSDESSLPSTPDIHKSMLNKSHSFSIASEVTQSSKESKTSSGGCYPPKRAKKDSSKSGSHNAGSNSDSGCPPPKKTRPKRGQYRKYNSQLLMDAVKAVQRGEMSVHRAGSYFGVPHSTLEYKVKERHLLRQKKSRDPQSPSSSSKSDIPSTTTQNTGRDTSPGPDDDTCSTSKKHNSASSTRSSSSSSSPPLSSIPSCQKTPPASTSKSFPSSSSSSSSPLPVLPSALGPASSKEVGSLAWFQPYLASPSHLDSSVGLMPSSLTLNNSASELLRKLQHKVQSKGASFPSDSAFELPCGKDRVFDLTQPTTSTGSLADRVALYNQSV